MITGIEHVAIASHHPHDLAAWYVDTLGLTVSSRSETSQMLRTPNGICLEVIQSEGNPLPAPQLRDQGLRHIALVVDDFAATYELFKSKSVRFLSEPFLAGGNSVVFFTDPDGNFLHLIQRPVPLT